SRIGKAARSASARATRSWPRAIAGCMIRPSDCWPETSPSEGVPAMKLKDVKERLEVDHCDLSGSSFHDVNLSGTSYDDINMSGWRIENVNLAGLKLSQANLAGAAIKDCRLEGMTIEGILVTELLATYRAAQKSEA